MHSIQLFIITSLGDSDGRRFSELKPKAMEPALFNYHLKQLLSSGLVIKNDSYYQLTPKGIQYIDQLNEEDLLPFNYPRLTMSLVYKSKDKGYLLTKINRQPLLNQIGLVLEDVSIAFKGPLEEYASVSFEAICDVKASFIHRGDGYIRLLDEQTTIANMLTHVMSASGPSFDINLNKDLIWQTDITKQEVYSTTNYVLDKLDNEEDYFFFENNLTV